MKDVLRLLSVFVYSILSLYYLAEGHLLPYGVYQILALKALIEFLGLTENVDNHPRGDLSTLPEMAHNSGQRRRSCPFE